MRITKTYFKAGMKRPTVELIYEGKEREPGQSPKSERQKGSLKNATKTPASEVTHE